MCSVSEDESGQETGSAYDSNSAAAIRLSSGMVLYMREVSSYLALVCIIRADNFTKRGKPPTALLNVLDVLRVTKK